MLKYINSSFANNQPDAEELAQKILECLKEHPDLNTVVAALESTSVYSIHIANYLSSCEELMAFKPYVFVLNPKCAASYKKSYIGLDKSDPIDAFVIADYARADFAIFLEQLLPVCSMNTILQSINGIGPIFAGGIVAEIGDISAFTSSDALAKYAGLCWKSNQSGDFNGEDNPMTKAVTVISGTTLAKLPTV